MQTFIVTLNAITPIFIIIILGFFLKKKGFVNDNFNKVASNIVFKVTLPIFLFVKIYNVDFDIIENLKVISFIYFGTILTFFISYFIAKWRKYDDDSLGVFVQGSFRGNFAIVGLALISSILGEKGFEIGSIILAFSLPIYNLLAIIALSLPLNNGNFSLGKTIIDILKNPLVLSVVFGLLFSVMNIELPLIIKKSGDYLAGLALPLALFGIGSSLSFSTISFYFRKTLLASTLKLLIFPLLMTYTAFLLGFRGEVLAAIFIFFGCPTALVSYIMAEGMKRNEKLAGSIVAFSTLASLLSVLVGVYLLRFFELL